MNCSALMQTRMNLPRNPTRQFVPPVNSCLSLILFFVLGTDITSSAGIAWAGAGAGAGAGARGRRRRSSRKEEAVSELESARCNVIPMLTKLTMFRTPSMSQPLQVRKTSFTKPGSSYCSLFNAKTKRVTSRGAARGSHVQLSEV
jgi:hypothetical protein